MGIEIETNKVKVKNNTSYNLQFFSVGRNKGNLTWALESDTIDSRARAQGNTDGANIEAKTFGGYGKKEIIFLIDELAGFLENLVETVSSAGYGKCDAIFKEKKAWLRPIGKRRSQSFSFQKDIIEKYLRHYLDTSDHSNNHLFYGTSVLEKDPYFCYRDQGLYLPQVTIQVSIREMEALFRFLRKEIKGKVDLKAFSPVERGFLTLLYYFKDRVFKESVRGPEVERGGENGVKKHLSLMPRVDLRVLFSLLSDDGQKEKIKKFLLDSGRIREFSKYKIRRYLDMGGEPVADPMTFADFVRYIVSDDPKEPRPQFYRHSSSLVFLDEEIQREYQQTSESENIIERGPLVILEFRGFKRLFEGDALSDIKNVKEKLKSFADSFFSF